jgi:hypothetical protein
MILGSMTLTIYQNEKILRPGLGLYQQGLR